MAKPQSKSQEPLLEADTVFFLGAGASEHLGFPLQKDFFQKARERKLLHGNHNLAKFLKRVGMAACQRNPPGFEAAYRRADMQVMLGKRHAADRCDEFLQLIGKAYAGFLQIHPPSNGCRSGYDSFHRLLIQLMGEPRSSDASNPRVAVLTTNYDLGFETGCVRTLCHGMNDGDDVARKLAEKYQESIPEDQQDELHERQLWDYCLPNRPRAQNPLSVPLLKLHGSVNWGMCTECDQVVWVEYVSDADWVRFRDEQVSIQPFSIDSVYKRSCQYHAEDEPPLLEPLLVPPTWTKWIGDFTRRFIWRQAYSALRSCSHLIFIGFSLPDEDLHIRELLMAGLAEKKERKVSVYDWCNSERRGRTARKLVRRYLAVLARDLGIPMKCEDFHLGKRFEESYEELAQDLRLATRSVF